MHPLSPHPSSLLTACCNSTGNRVSGADWLGRPKSNTQSITGTGKRAPATGQEAHGREHVFLTRCLLAGQATDVVSVWRVRKQMAGSTWQGPHGREHMAGSNRARLGLGAKDETQHVATCVCRAGEALWAGRGLILLGFDTILGLGRRSAVRVCGAIRGRRGGAGGHLTHPARPRARPTRLESQSRTRLLAAHTVRCIARLGAWSWRRGEMDPGVRVETHGARSTAHWA